MEINLDATAIQDAVVRAIADSAIGEQITKVIESQFTAKEKSWDNESIMQTAIRNEITRVVTQIIREEILKLKDKIRELILPKITDEVLTDISSAAIEAMTGRLKTI